MLRNTGTFRIGVVIPKGVDDVIAPPHELRRRIRGGLPARAADVDPRMPAIAAVPRATKLRRVGVVWVILNSFLATSGLDSER